MGQRMALPLLQSGMRQKRTCFGGTSSWVLANSQLHGLDSASGFLQQVVKALIDGSGVGHHAREGVGANDDLAVDSQHRAIAMTERMTAEMDGIFALRKAA